MAKDEDKRTDLWTTGTHTAFRSDLVAWPTSGESAVAERGTSVAPAPALQPAPPPTTASTSTSEEAVIELARAKAEVRRLLARIEALVEENERLRRAAGQRYTVG